MKKKDLIVVRGAGDLATGTIHRLKKAGFRLLVLEAEHPAAGHIFIIHKKAPFLKNEKLFLSFHYIGKYPRLQEAFSQKNRPVFVQMCKN